MSAVYLKLTAVLCLSCTALSNPGSRGVVGDFGGAVTIQCRAPKPEQVSLTLTKGLSEELVLFINGLSNRNNTAKEFRNRLQLIGVFPYMDIVIKNLTFNDTGVYWCIYNSYDSDSNENVKEKGEGPVFLVVTDTTHRCDNNMILVSVVICAAALLGIIIFFITWRILKAKMRTTKKPQRVGTNDVYEDMRGTIRR